MQSRLLPASVQVGGVVEQFEEFCTRLGGAITRREQRQGRTVLTCALPRGRVVLRSLHIDKARISLVVEDVTAEKTHEFSVRMSDNVIPSLLRFEGRGRLFLEASSRTGVTDVVFYDEKPMLEEITLVVEERLGLEHVLLELRAGVSIRV